MEYHYKSIIHLDGLSGFLNESFTKEKSLKIVSWVMVYYATFQHFLVLLLIMVIVICDLYEPCNRPANEDDKKKYMKIHDYQ